MLNAVKGGEVLKDWKLLDARNENKTTGFVGYLLEDRHRGGGGGLSGK